MFHETNWPGVAMVHLGVKPEAWGKGEGLARETLMEFCAAIRPRLIVAWIPSWNRAALRFARAVGFEQSGQMVLADETVIQLSWRP